MTRVDAGESRYPGFHAILVLRWSRVRYHLKDETSCFEARPFGRPSA